MSDDPIIDNVNFVILFNKRTYSKSTLFVVLLV
jgi:hypothetical protein